MIGNGKCHLNGKLNLKIHHLYDKYIVNSNSTTQSGFQANYGTCTALLHVTDDLFRTFDNSGIANFVLLDYRKAFHTVHHATLCTKLNILILILVLLTLFTLT